VFYEVILKIKEARFVRHGVHVEPTGCGKKVTPKVFRSFLSKRLSF